MTESTAPPPESPDVPAAANGVCWACKSLFLLALIPAFYFGAPLLLPIVLAVLFNLLLSPAVRAFKRMGLPSPLGALLVLVVVLAIIVGGLWQLASPALDWVERAPGVVRELQAKLRPIQRSVQQVQKATQEVEKATDVEGGGGTRSVKVSGPSLMERLLQRAQSVVVGAFLMLVLLYFLMASDDFFLRKVVRVTPNLRNKIRAVEIGRAIEVEIGRYFSAFTLLNVALGTLVAIVLYVLGLPSPALWGTMVAVLNYVPYLGPAISLTVITIVSLLTFDELPRALLPPLVYMVIDAIEGNLVEPMLFGRSLSLNPVAIFVALLFWGWLWGAAGILLAVPILIVVKITCQHIESLNGVAEFLDRR
ncbi:MAG TPA: AI-2E family transporter [Burkholderiales bacterium]|nr:AI-2E family transporter [Burkholderiales bacterium]